jgi:hypothetical protein
MKTVIRISTDYQNDGAYRDFQNEINYLVNDEVDCFCDVANDRFVNIVEEQKRYKSSKEDYKNTTVVEAIGYSQGDWQSYTIHHNLEQDDKRLEWLIDELKKSFTHMNDYIVEKFEREEINGKNFDAEPHDYTTFCIRHTEFPDKEDVLKEYNSIWGEDYDEVTIEIE